MLRFTGLFLGIPKLASYLLSLMSEWW